MMSFSADIKKVLCTTGYECPGCRRAELAGFFVFPNRLGTGEAHINCASVPLAERIAKALFDELAVKPDYSGRRLILSAAQTERIYNTITDEDVINTCCITAYIRGAFLATGSVTNPEKEYHLDFNTKSFHEAQYLMELLSKLGFKPKATRRKDKKIIYLKENAQIADLIGYISGGRAGLEILSIQVEKELKSSAQRQVNCDSANLDKQAKASARQIAAIKKIKSARKWSSMPEVLREIGELRLKYPDMSIEELGKHTKQEIGKSGVNHRLKRIIDYADTI